MLGWVTIVGLFAAIGLVSGVGVGLFAGCLLLCLMICLWVIWFQCAMFAGGLGIW